MSRARAPDEDYYSELLRVFHVGVDDIAANRNGWLSPGQARRMVRSGYLNMVLAALMAAGLLGLILAVAERPFEPVQIIITLTLVGALLVLGSYYLIRQTQAAAAGVVVCHSGPISVALRGRAGWYLTVADESFKFPIQRWHVQNGLPYHVYVTPKSRTIVAMEPAWN